jgi:hypothetical protein
MVTAALKTKKMEAPRLVICNLSTLGCKKLYLGTTAPISTGAKKATRAFTKKRQANVEVTKSVVL